MEPSTSAIPFYVQIYWSYFIHSSSDYSGLRLVDLGSLSIQGLLGLSHHLLSPTHVVKAGMSLVDSSIWAKDESQLSWLLTSVNGWIKWIEHTH